MSTNDSLSERARKMFTVIERYNSSDLTQKSFCTAEGLALSTFQYWLGRYRKQQEWSAVSSPQRFVALTPRLQSVPDLRQAAIVVSYANGVTLSLNPPVNGSLDLKLLKELITL